MVAAEPARLADNMAVHGLQQLLARRVCRQIVLAAVELALKLGEPFGHAVH